MAYRFKSSDRSMADGMRRIAAEEFALVQVVLADAELPPARKVHEGRKATKRLRALLRLAAPAMPDARNEIRALREAAASLSALRDRSALSEVVPRLDLPGDISDPLKRLLAPKRAAATRLSRSLLSDFAGRIEDAAARAESWRLSEKGWHALEAGLERSHRRFCNAARAARHADSEDPVHELRKRAKDHWYQTLLLRSAFPEAMEGYASAGERLSDDLGDWRDFGLLEDVVRLAPARRLSTAEAEAALEVIGKARRRALKRAFRTVRLLTAESPSAYASRIATWWHVST